MTRSRTLAALGFAAVLGMVLPRYVSAQTMPQAPAAGTRVDVSRLGPQVGQRIPDFTLRDQTGKTWTRASIAGPKGAMLVFFRSADW